MITLTTEQAQQIEEALECAIGIASDHNRIWLGGEKALATIRAARAQEQAALAWHDKIKGMEVSMDVSTGEDDAHYRIFGRVDGVMLQSCGAQEDTILVIEDSRNYAAPVRTKDLTDDEILAIAIQYDLEEGISDVEYGKRVIAAYKKKNK